MSGTSKTFGSLFAGVGGFDLGFERAGHTCKWQVEIDKHCQKILRKHFPKARLYSDVRQTSQLEPVDIICGGFPCQDVSVAGKRKGMAGKRSSLWFQFARIVAELKPSWVVIENVPGLLSSNGGRDFATVIRGLDECGYFSAWRILNSQYWGVPQRRRRIFIVSSLGNGRCIEVLFESDGLPWNPKKGGTPRQGAPDRTEKCFGIGGFGDYKEGVSQLRHKGGDIGGGSENLIFNFQRSDQYKQSDISHTLSHRDYKSPTDLIFDPRSQDGTPRVHSICPTLNTMTGGQRQPCVAYPILTPERKEQRQQGKPYRDNNEPMFTLNTQDKHGVAQKSSVRRLTPRECERLQGFPDDWTASVSDTQRYKQMGNAVTVQVAEWIGKRLL